MTWLILIVRLGRAAPRQRRRIFAELATAGAVGISEGVWAIPDTSIHRTAVDACARRAVDAGGDIVMLNTSPENSPTHDVLEAALTERLTAEAAVLARQCEDFATRPDAPADRGAADRDRTLGQLQLEAYQLTRRDVIGLEVVDSVVALVGRIAALPPASATAAAGRH